jgi:hypothetical protein
MWKDKEGVCSSLWLKDNVLDNFVEEQRSERDKSSAIMPKLCHGQKWPYGSDRTTPLQCVSLRQLVPSKGGLPRQNTQMTDKSKRKAADPEIGITPEMIEAGKRALED